MKKIFSILALSFLFSLTAYAQDVAVFGLSQTAVTDEAQGIIASYSSMESTFQVALASNVYHEAALFEGLNTQFTPILFDYKRFFAEIGFSVGGAGYFTDYYYGARYFLEMIDVGPCGGGGNFFLDYWGFGLLPQDHPSPFTWLPTGLICQSTALVFLGGIPVIASLTQAPTPDQQIMVGCKSGTFRNCSVNSDKTMITFSFTTCDPGGSNARVTYTRKPNRRFRFEYTCLANGYMLKTFLDGNPLLDTTYNCNSC